MFDIKKKILVAVSLAGVFSLIISAAVLIQVYPGVNDKGSGLILLIPGVCVLVASLAAAGFVINVSGAPKKKKSPADIPQVKSAIVPGLVVDQLIQAQKLELLGALAGGVAHYFNNLLMAIQGNAGLIRARTERGHPNLDKIDRIMETVNIGAEVIQQLLSFARAGESEPRSLRLNSVLKESLSLFSKTRKAIEIKNDLQPDLWKIVADRAQIIQVVFNLLQNASDAIPKAGFITVSSRNIVLDSNGADAVGLDPGNYVMIRIQDTGEGMSPETLDRLFDPFFTTRSPGRGTGLGLAACWNIVSKYKGKILAAQSQSGDGSCFTLYLPAESGENS